ncbi:sporulation protein YqfD, partial [Klebsiella pneumoniae]|uniref:sporulation protein YqfD n=1 Tax=Klebsiella pneumoniae TaxID=573 RepID=UPI0021B13F18
MRVVGRYGLPFRLRRHWKRKGAVAGITLFFVLLYMMSDYLWAIDIEGNTRYTDDTLLQFIYSTGISHGMKYDTIACEELEKAIRNQYN